MLWKYKKMYGTVIYLQLNSSQQMGKLLCIMGSEWIRDFFNLLLLCWLSRWRRQQQQTTTKHALVPFNCTRQTFIHSTVDPSNNKLFTIVYHVQMQCIMVQYNFFSLFLCICEMKNHSWICYVGRKWGEFSLAFCLSSLCLTIFYIGFFYYIFWTSIKRINSVCPKFNCVLWLQAATCKKNPSIFVYCSYYNHVFKTNKTFLNDDEANAPENVASTRVQRIWRTLTKRVFIFY